MEKNLLALEHFLRPFDIAEYGKVRATLEKSGKIIGGLDMMIAAHARSLNSILVTNNIKEFERVDGLVVENWV